MKHYDYTVFKSFDKNFLGIDLGGHNSTGMCVLLTMTTIYQQTHSVSGKSLVLMVFKACFVYIYVVMQPKAELEGTCQVEYFGKLHVMFLVLKCIGDDSLIAEMVNEQECL